MATAVAAPTKFHSQVAGFQAFGEFHGFNTDCLVDAEMMARHPFDGTPLDAPTIDGWWQQDYLNTKHADSHGATLADGYWHLTQSAHKLDPGKVKISKYVPTGSMSLADTHVNLIHQLALGCTVMGFLQNAQALTYNERGVFGHFVAWGGLDTDLGYLTGNGDDVAALGGHGIILTRWYGWQNLANAQLNGFIALAKVTPPPPAPDPEAQQIAQLQLQLATANTTINTYVARLAQIAALAQEK